MNEPVTPTDPGPRRLPRRGFGFPLALVAFGLVALLANYGVLGPVSLLSLLALWPLILVLIGIDLLLAHRMPALALAADAAVIVLGLALVLTRPTLIGFPAFVFDGTDCGRDRQATVSAPRDSAQRTDLRVSAGATKLTMSGGAGGLLEANSSQSDLRLRTTAGRAGSAPEVRLDQCGAGAFGGGANSGDLRVRVANDVPIALNLSAGAATMDVDLHDVQLTDARIAMGAATMALQLPKPSGDLRVAISSGASTITVQVPPGVDYSVTLSGGLSTLNGAGTFAGRNATETPGYATARDRVSMTVNAGISTVTVK